MKNLFTIAFYTIKETVKKKVFIFSNIIIIAIILVGFNLPNFINPNSGSNTEGEDVKYLKGKYLFIDNKNIFENKIPETLEKDNNVYYTKTVTDEPTEEFIYDNIMSGEYSAVVVIEKEQNQINLEYIVESEGIFFKEPTELINMVDNLYKKLQLSKMDISAEEKEILNSDIEYTMRQVEGGGQTNNIILLLVLSIGLFFSIYFFAFQVSSSITIEKTSKIIETLVTSTKPSTIVLGKTIGMGLLGIIQIILIITICAILGNALGTFESLSGIIDFSNMTGRVLVITLVYYFLGYLLFSAFYAITGAIVNKPEDVQSANIPVSILAIIGFYLAYFSLTDPTGKVNEFAGMFPLSSPFCMPLRVMMDLSGKNEIASSILALLISTVIAMSAAIRIYSTAILNNGTKISFKDMVKIYFNKY